MVASTTVEHLRTKHCEACRAGMPPADEQRIQQVLSSLPDWQYKDNQLQKTYRFGNFHETMAFVNAVAWIAHREDHHPDLEVGYNRCHIRYSTHAIHGVTENDLICAAKVESLLTD